MSLITVLFIVVFIHSASCYGQYYDLSNQVSNGSELKSTLLNENEFIVMTVWFNHLRYNEYQNQRNLMIQSSVKDLIRRCHPYAMYTEADVSGYSESANTFIDRAKEWRLQLTDLYDGPILMVIYDCHGENFWGTADARPYNLIHTVDQYIRYLERTYFKNEAPA